jgi:hypothetical protein
MHHSIKNRGVWIASFRLTLRSVIIALVTAGGFHPSGFQPAGGRSSNREPISMIARYVAPSAMTVFATPMRSMKKTLR